MRIFRQKFWGALLLLIFVATAPSHAAIVLGLSPVTQTVTVGGAVQVDLTISGLGVGSAPSLGTYDVDIGFDPFILGFVGASFGDPVLGNQLDLLGLGSINIATPGTGTVNLFELSLDDVAMLEALQSDSFTLARLEFSTLSGGTSVLDIGMNAIGDALGDSLVAVTVGARVTSVPEPGSLLLIVAAMLGLVVCRRRRCASAIG